MPEVAVQIVTSCHCPFCAIGVGRLQAVAKRNGFTLNIEYLPWHSHADIPSDGMERAEFLGKFMGGKEAAIAIMRSFNESEAGKRAAELRAEDPEGCSVPEFNFVDDQRIFNDFIVHKLCEHPAVRQTPGLTYAIHTAVKRLYFQDCEFIDKPRLAELARQLGITEAVIQEAIFDENAALEEKTRAALWNDRSVPAVTQGDDGQDITTTRKITSIPVYIFPGGVILNPTPDTDDVLLAHLRAAAAAS